MVIEMKGDPKIGIPSNSFCRVVSVPEQTTVWEGTASGGIALDLDPGKYSLTVVKSYPKRDGVLTYSQVYLVGCTEKELELLKNLDAKFVKTNYTSQGTTYSCGVRGCENVTRSLFAANVHEAKHFGIDILKDMSQVYKLNDMSAKFAPTLAAIPTAADVPVLSVGGKDETIGAAKVVEKPMGPGEVSEFVAATPAKILTAVPLVPIVATEFPKETPAPIQRQAAEFPKPSAALPENPPKQLPLNLIPADPVVFKSKADVKKIG